MTDTCTLCLAGSAVETDREFRPSTDVLISKADLLDKIQLIKDLSVRKRELEMEQAYKTQKSDLMHAQKVKELQEGYCQAIKELKEKNEVRIMRCEKFCRDK
jgi:ribosome biogenesis GTPase A